MSTAFFSSFIVQDFQDSPDDEEDTRSSQEYMNDLEEESSKSSFSKSKRRFFFARDCWSKTSLPSYQSPFQPKHLHSSKHKPELRHTKDLEAKYNKVKAKLALLSSSASAPSRELTNSSEDTSSSGLKDPVFVKSSANNLEVFITSSNKPKLSDAEYFTLSNDDTGITINERSSAPARGNKSSLVSKTNSAPAGTDPHVLADQTKSVIEGLETVLTQPRTRKGANSIARQVEEEEASNTIKLEDLAKLVSNVQCSFKDLDSPEDDPVIVVDDSDEDEEDESQKHKLELKKNKAEAKVALFKAQPFFPNIRQLNELLDIPSKFNELTEEVKVLKQQVHELEIELPGDLKEIPSKLEDFTKTVALVQAKLKTLDALLGLLLNVIKILNKFAQVLDSASSKVEDQSVPSAGQDDTMPAAEEKNTNQATISQLFQTKAENNAERKNLKQTNNQTNNTTLL
ncbi:hypothetical protein Tco_0289575 [Tanacetum coccineum]